MTDSEKSAIKVTDASFATDVLSAASLCWLNFWATWCGPCKMVARPFSNRRRRATDLCRQSSTWTPTETARNFQVVWSYLILFRTASR